MSYEQRTFETANASSASIVRPTLPKNVLGEFEHFTSTGNRFKKQNPFDSDEDEESRNENGAALPPPPGVTRNPPPLPPQTLWTQQQLQPQPSSSEPVKIEFKEFGEFSLSKPSRFFCLSIAQIFGVAMLTISIRHNSYD